MKTGIFNLLICERSSMSRDTLNQEVKNRNVDLIYEKSRFMYRIQIYQ